MKFLMSTGYGLQWLLIASAITVIAIGILLIITLPRWYTESSIASVINTRNTKLIINPQGINEPSVEVVKDPNLMVSLTEGQEATDSSDLCLYLVFALLGPTNRPINFNGTYIIAYGGRNYGDSLGTVMVDFCLIWNGLVYRGLNGFSVGYAQLYSVIEYLPEHGAYIKYLKLFQDAYASYMAYEYETNRISASQLPGDVKIVSVGNYSPGYWTIDYYVPYPMQCMTVEKYRATLTLGYTIQAPSISSTYYCSQYTISLSLKTLGTMTPLKFAAYNLTWVFKPTSRYWASQPVMYGVESEGYTYMGSADSPEPSVYIIPVGASVVVYKPYGCTYYLFGFIPMPGVLVDHIVYDVDWYVFVNSNGTVSIQSHGMYIPPPGMGRNWREVQSPYIGLQGFYYTRQCQPIWWLWW